METNDEEYIIKVLRDKYDKALLKYNGCKSELEASELDLNKSILALNAFIDEPIDIISSSSKAGGNAPRELEVNDQRTLTYDSGASVRKKIIRVLQINDRAMSKNQIAQYIFKQEPNQTIEELKRAMGTPMHFLVKSGEVAQSKVKNVKTKGYYYGKPQWLLSDGIWIGSHEPEMDIQQKNLWD